MSVLLWRKKIGKSMMEILLYAWSQYKSILHTFNYQERCHIVSNILQEGEALCPVSILLLWGKWQ